MTNHALLSGTSGLQEGRAHGLGRTLFAEGKQWHSARRFRLRLLWRVNCEPGAIPHSGSSAFQRTRGRSPRPSGLGRNATVQCFPFPLFLFSERRVPCRLRHFSSEKRDGSPTGTLTTEHSVSSGRESAAGKMFSVERSLFGMLSKDGTIVRSP
jgi:hypothetical protein